MYMVNTNNKFNLNREISKLLLIRKTQGDVRKKDFEYVS